MKKPDLTMNLEPKEFDLNTIQKEIPFIARCIKNDPVDDRVGYPMENRWLEGDEIRVVKIEMTHLGTFLHNREGQNLNIRRAGLIMFCKNDLSEEQWKKHTEIMDWIGEHYPDCKNLPIKEQDRIGKEAWKAIME